MALILSLWPMPGQARFVDGIDFVCPCEIEFYPDTNEVDLTFGVKNFRPTGTGTLDIRVNRDWAPALYLSRQGQGTFIRLEVQSLPPGATLRRFTYRLSGQLAATEFVRGAASEMLYLHAYEGETAVATAWLSKRESESAETALRYRDLDFLTDTDGDGVADANEEIEGTDAMDPDSAPGESTIDVLALYDDHYSARFGDLPHVRIHHLMALANLAYVDSGTNIRLRTVGLEVGETYNEEYGSALTEQSKQRLADLHGADLMVFFIGPHPGEERRFGGSAPLVGPQSRGYMPKHRSTANARIHFGASADVVPHEIGHMLGLGHSYADNSIGTFRWSRGHPMSSWNGTVMAYTFGPHLRFSDPDVQCWRPDTACGVSRNEWDGADAVTSLNAVRFQVARYRQSKADSDGDGIVDPADLFPQDVNEWNDTDGDGVGDTRDQDDDNDSVPDADDLFPLDASEWEDSDGDGIGDNADGDGVSDDQLIPDRALREIVRQALGLGSDKELLKSDLESLTIIRRQCCPGSGVASLEGLQYATNLQELVVYGGSVRDLSPLSNLEQLRSLYLNEHRIHDIKPLAGLSLQVLNLSGNHIVDVSSLSDMNSLRYLNLFGNFLSKGSLGQLSTLTSLRTLSLANDTSDSGISDLSPIASLQRLEVFSISGSLIEDIGPIAELTELRGLQLSNTSVSDISPLKALEKLQWVGLSRTLVTDIEALKGLPELTGIQFANNEVRDLSLFAGFDSLSDLWVVQNEISDISHIVDSQTLADDSELSLQGNPLSRLAVETHIPALQARGIEVEFDAASEYEIPDASLKEALAEAASGSSATAMTDRDHLRVRFLNLADLGITNFSGIEHASRLEFVNLAGNDINDLSPLLGLSNLRHLTLDADTLNNERLQDDIEALRNTGVIIGEPATADEFAKFNECQPSMLLGPGEDCTYPNSEERFLVLPGGLAKFLFGTFADSLKVDGAVGDSEYHLVASREGGTVWRIERVAGQAGGSSSVSTSGPNLRSAQ